jgi:hypothetical protein
MEEHFSIKKEARKIEELASDAMHEGPHELSAEKKLIAELQSLTPLQTREIKFQISTDNMKANGLPELYLNLDRYGKISNLEIHPGGFSSTKSAERIFLDKDGASVTVIRGRTVNDIRIDNPK